MNILEGENGLMLAVTGSNALLCTGNAFGRSATFGVRGAKQLTFDKIDLRMSLFCAGVATPLSKDDFFINVFGVAGVSNSRSARTFRYGGDSKCNLVCIIVAARNGRIIGFPSEERKKFRKNSLLIFMFSNKFNVSRC